LLLLLWFANIWSYLAYAGEREFGEEKREKERKKRGIARVVGEKKIS